MWKRRTRLVYFECHVPGSFEIDDRWLARMIYRGQLRQKLANERTDLANVASYRKDNGRDDVEGRHTETRLSTVVANNTLAQALYILKELGVGMWSEASVVLGTR